MVKKIIATALISAMVINSATLTAFADTERGPKQAYVIDKEAWTETVQHPGHWETTQEAWDELVKEAWTEEIKHNAQKTIVTKEYTEIIDVPERIQQSFWFDEYAGYAEDLEQICYCRTCGDIWNTKYLNGEKMDYSYIKDEYFPWTSSNCTNGHTDWCQFMYVTGYTAQCETEVVPAKHEEIKHKATTETIDLGFDTSIKNETVTTKAWVEEINHPEEKIVACPGKTVDVVEWYTACARCGNDRLAVRRGEEELCNCYDQYGTDKVGPRSRVVGHKDLPTIYETNAAWTERVQHPEVVTTYKAAWVEKINHPAEYKHHDAVQEWVNGWTEYIEHPAEGHYVDVEIKGICQMPYFGKGGGYLIGIETDSNPKNQLRYEMKILDCSLLRDGKDAWIYTTGQCAPADGNYLWTIWQPEYGYFWTLFSVYDRQGNLVDERCYGFVNAY